MYKAYNVSTVLRTLARYNIVCEWVGEGMNSTVDEKLSVELQKLDDLQKEKVLKYLYFHYSPDIWKLGNGEIRNKVYADYAGEVAELIAKIEVYAHDLPPQVGALVERLWHMLTTATIAEGETNKSWAYLSLEKYVIHVINELRSTLVVLYTKAIRGYAKTLKNFNYQTILDDDGRVVYDQIITNMGSISSFLRNGRHEQQKYLCKSYFDKKYDVLNYEEINEVTEFSDALSLSEYTLALCEKYYSSIIHNGYSSTPLKKILAAIPDIISFGFTILGCYQLIRIFFKF